MLWHAWRKQDWKDDLKDPEIHRKLVGVLKICKYWIRSFGIYPQSLSYESRLDLMQLQVKEGWVVWRPQG